MNNEQRLALLLRYDHLIWSLGGRAQAHPVDHLLVGNDEMMGHCRWMIEQMRQFVADGNLDEFDRWLGFLQACLWCRGLYSLSQLQDHKRGSG